MNTNDYYNTIIGIKSIPTKLRTKLLDAVNSYQRDELFELINQPYCDFFKDIENIPEKRNHIPYKPQMGYGTYEEQQLRLKGFLIKLSEYKSNDLLTRNYKLK